ncbi:MAG: energy-coupling factor transporter transmembrane protein EcfT [Oscillospiraceae bacterium]|nr:energy-coupling factor transporter transmembrane protein EcfT [Oscillospiraceae bacterium]
MRDVSLGRFLQTGSIVHKLDPRVKLALAFVYSIVVFVFDNWLGLAVNASAVLLVYRVSRIPLKIFLKNLKLCMPMIFVAGVINIFFVPGEQVFRLWFLVVTKQGLHTFFLMVARVVCLVSGTAILTLTTSPLLLVAALEFFLQPLRMFGVSPNEVSVMLSIAFRFIPVLIEEAARIVAAQKSRGAAFDSAGIKQKIRAYVTVLVPLFCAVCKRAEDLANAMESRCFVGGDNRTRYRVLCLSPTDFVAIGCFLAYILALCALQLISMECF